MTESNEMAQKRAQVALAKALDVPVRDLEVELCDGANVPGLVPFRGRQLSKKGKRGSYTVGVMSKTGIETDDDKAIAEVVQALRGDSKKGPDPSMTARVVGFLQGDVEPAHAILSDKDSETLNPLWRPYVYLPRTATVEGEPAIEFWVRGHGLKRTQIVLKPDGTIDLSVRSIGQYLPR